MSMFDLLETAFFNGIAFSFSGQTVAAIPLVVSFVAISTSNYVLRAGKSARATVALRAAQVILACALGLVIGGIIIELIHDRFELASRIRQNRGQAILLFGLYFLVLRRFVFAPLGRFIRDRMAPGLLQRLALRIYETLVHGPYWNAIRLSFALVVGIAIPIFLIPWLGAVHAAIVDCVRQDATHTLGLKLLVVEWLGL